MCRQGKTGSIRNARGCAAVLLSHAALERFDEMAHEAGPAARRVILSRRLCALFVSLREERLSNFVQRAKHPFLWLR